jgi:4-amino-4-deoxy-L-arabinose transferase-like glycosyltransferase
VAPTVEATHLRPTTRRGWWFFGATLLLALVLRVGVVVSIHDSYVPVNDALSFDHIATELANGHGFGDTLLPPAEGPTAYRAPLYPLSLGALYTVVGDHKFTWGLLEEAGIGTIVAGLIGVVAAQLFGRRVGAVALLIAAVHPTLMLFGSSLQLEPLLELLTLATIAAALESRRRGNGLRWPLFTGVLVGLSILTRELGFLVAVPIALLVWTGRTRSEGASRWSRQVLAGPAAVAIAAIAVVAPYTIRNAVRFHAFVPVSTSSGFTLVGTYNETAYANKKDPALWIPAYQDPGLVKIITKHQHPTEVQLDNDLRRETFSFAADHPSYLPKVAFWNTVRLFDLQGPQHALYIGKFIPYPFRLIRLAVYGSYLTGALAIAAVFLARTRRAPWLVWLIPLVVFITIALVSGNIRYRASIEPFTILLASVAVTTGLERLGVFDRRNAQGSA